MKKETFQKQFRELLPGSKPEAARAWQRFAEECVDNEQYVHFKAAKSRDACVEEWLEVLYEGLRQTKLNFGVKLAARVSDLGCESCCLYPGEMTQAAEYLLQGSGVEEIMEGIKSGDIDCVDLFSVMPPKVSTRDSLSKRWREDIMKENILKQLQTKCPFPEAFEDMEYVESAFDKAPRRKIGHIRADYNGHRWWNSAWPCHPELATEAVKAEIDQVYDALTAKDALKDLPTLARFCEAHPEACADREFRQEYNFYLTGESCDFWIRLITRERDYNLYLNAYAKAAT